MPIFSDAAAKKIRPRLEAPGNGYSLSVTHSTRRSGSLLSGALVQVSSAGRKYAAKIKRQNGKEENGPG